MNFDVKFYESQQEFDVDFGEVQTAHIIIPPAIEPLTITENGTYTAPEAVDGYSPVTVNVPAISKVGDFTQYAKLIATPESTTMFTIENPLGGIAKHVSVIMTPYELTSKRRCRKFVADYDLGIAVGEYSDTASVVLYTSKLTTNTVGNATFKITEGQIILYRYNSANAWDENSEYEVEIYQ